MAKILIAEDEKDIRDLITILLQFGGHTVITKKRRPMANRILWQVCLPYW